MKQKSVQFNAFISGFQKLLSVIFPLITFPYITRILQVEMIGKINFSTSIISYFILLAGLGINNYAVREGATIRENKDKINKFCSEIFTINILSTIISCILLIIVYFAWEKLHDYKLLLIIQSLSIIGGTIGINWLYSIYEDYIYITVRTLIFQILSLVLMFIFVKSQGDFYIYVLITMFANVGANVFNLIHSKKYVNIKIVKNINLKKHIKPIMIIFASTIAITIYVNSDITILGWICDDYVVGIYSVSVKVYSVLKQIIAAMVIVALPKMSKLFGEQKNEEYKKLVNKFFNFLFIITIPCAFGIFSISGEIVRVISGDEYIQAISSLRILSISLIFSVFSSFVTYFMILPAKNEKIQLWATIISAAENLLFNFLLIPIFKENAAAFTTLLAEIIVFAIEFIAFIKINKNISANILKVDLKNLFSCLIECLFIILISIIIHALKFNYIIQMIIIVFLSVIFFIIVGIVIKNDLYNYIKNIINKGNKNAEAN